MDERRAWQQRIHAQLYHQGVPPIRGLLTGGGRAALETAALSAAGRQIIEVALAAIDSLTAQIPALRAQPVTAAKAQPGCRALQRLYGVGWLCAAIVWAELGDCRRFARSEQAVLRHQALTGHLARQGSAELRWALYEAAKCAARPSSPDYRYYAAPKRRRQAPATSAPAQVQINLICASRSNLPGWSGQRQIGGSGARCPAPERSRAAPWRGTRCRVRRPPVPAQHWARARGGRDRAG